MMPIVDGLEAEFGRQMSFLRLDAALAENAAYQAQLDLFGHPNFAVIDRQGEVAARFTGPAAAETLRAALEQMLANQATQVP